jgi:hypothetical protein
LGVLDTLQTYLQFLMLHACFTPIALCFVYTLWHFYAFFGTNLLTRCHSASSCFLLFLCFGKVTQEILSELDETKPKVPILLSRRRSPKGRRRRARRKPHQVVARVPLVAPPGGVGYSNGFILVISRDTLSHDVKVTVCALCVSLRLNFAVILIMSYDLSWMSL